MSVKKLFSRGLMAALAAALIVALAPAFSAQAAPAPQDGVTPDQRTVTVTGYGTAYGAPDIVTVGLGVEASNADILTAMDDATQRMNQVIDALEGQGIASEDIRTEHFSIYQDYYGGPSASGERPEPIYRVSMGVNITVRETSRVGVLLSTAVKAGANLVNYVNFDIDDRAPLQSDARSSAVADARDRAQQLADILGLTVGEPLKVIEEAQTYFGLEARGMGGGGAGASALNDAIREGQLGVSIAVTITFALQASA